MPKMTCLTCGSTMKPRTNTPGSLLLEIAAWLLLLVPGLIYSLWRVSARRKVCSCCGSEHIVPTHSPAARSIATK